LESGDIRIQLCGSFVVRIAGTRVDTALSGRQLRLLFAYLVMGRLRSIGRDELVAAVWGAQAPPAVDTALNALVSKVRKAVGAQRLEGRSELRLSLPSPTSVDVEVAADALHRAQAAAQAGRWGEVYAAARIARYTFVRPFMQGEEAAWVADQRRVNDEALNDALELCAEVSLRLGGSEVPIAISSARELIKRAPFRESGYAVLMRALSAQGNVAEALLAFDQVRTLLRDELGTSPGPALRKVHLDLLQQTDA
jgi:SARP family transcriptional regulator, regulator of embCAB operon